MADRAECARDIADPGPDVSPFATTHFEFGMVRIGLTQEANLVDEDLAGFELRHLAVSRQVVGALAFDPDGREARRDLFDLAHKPRQNPFDLLARRTNGAVFDNFPF